MPRSAPVAEEGPPVVLVDAIAAVSATEALAGARTLPDLQVSLFASEPDVQQPIGMAFDDRGRLWVAECSTYRGLAEAVNRIVVLEDHDGDGVHDQRTVFAEGLDQLSAIEVGWGGAWVCSGPSLLFIPDLDGDLRPDSEPIVILDGWNERPSHDWHMPNHLCWGPDGWLYGCLGFGNASLVGRPGTPKSRRIATDAGVWRVHPTTHQFEMVARGTCNPWGIDFDEYGRLFVSNNVVDHLWRFVPGGRYQRWGSKPMMGTYEMMTSCVDHHHWEGNDQWHGDSAEAGGGHSHAGLLLYQGGAWPDSLRGIALLGNIHGNRICADVFADIDGSVVAQHGPDVLQLDDPGFRCVDIKSGPDGQVYACDWNANGECHQSDYAGTGRIYRITSAASTNGPTDLSQLTPGELIGLQEHPNQWFARRARLQLQMLASVGEIPTDLVDQVAATAADRTLATPGRLRAVWTWHQIAPANASGLLEKLLDDPAPMVAAWAIRLLVQRQGANRTTAAMLAKLWDDALAAEVRLELLSVTQRFAGEDRRRLVEPAMRQLTDELPRNDQLLAWYAIEPLVAADPSWGAAQETPGAFLRYAVTRRICEQWVVQPTADSMHFILQRMPPESEDAPLASWLQALHDGLSGYRKSLPSPLVAILDRLQDHPSSAVQSVLATMPWLSADKLLSIVKDNHQRVDRRCAALEHYLATEEDAETDDLLWTIAASGPPELASVAIQGLASPNNHPMAEKLLTAFPNWDQLRQQATLEALSSRADFVDNLLVALETGKLKPTDISPDIAMRIRNWGNPDELARLEACWGTLRKSPAQLQAEMERVQTLVTQTQDPEADAMAGKIVFRQRCGACHLLKSERAGWGPNLNAVDRSNLSFWLTNVIDPNAVVPAGFCNVIVETTDGRGISGALVEESIATVTLRNATHVTTIAKDEIEELKQTAESVMPTGVLSGLTDQEIRDLFAYLMN